MTQPGGISLSTRTCVGRGRPRCADFPAWREYLYHAEGNRRSNDTCRVAANARNPRKSCCQAYSNLCLRSLLPGPWSHGSGFEPVGRKIRQPGDICLACRMGGSHHHGVMPLEQAQSPDPGPCRYWRTSSTRRLRARPSSVSLLSTGREAPNPSLASRSGAMLYCVTSASLTARSNLERCKSAVPAGLNS
jgi:hypothetical protein